MKNVLFLLGTRPEGIKLAPLIREINQSSILNSIVCSTGQHQEMLKQVLDFLEVEPDFHLKVMTSNQSLNGLTAKLLTAVDEVLQKVNPDLIIVQGDTTSTMVGALSAFYRGIKIAHLEAGLRSFDKSSPFPEEINRIITSKLADYHFAPTLKAQNNLFKEGIPGEAIYMVGNTVVDALLFGLEKVKDMRWETVFPQLQHVDLSKKIILVTGHRRENFGKPFEEICSAIRKLGERNDVEIIYPVHLNPNVKETVFSLLRGQKNIHLIEPLLYSELIYLMQKSYFVLTDSGGIQEEAPSLQKPVLIMRNVTERMEGVEEGVAKLVGTNAQKIYAESLLLLENKSTYNAMSAGGNPYGDGTTSKQVRKILESKL